MRELHGFVFLLCLLFSQPSLALRCGSWVVEPGDFKQDVYDVCGEPDSMESHYETRIAGNYADFTQHHRGARRYSGGAFNYGQEHYREIEVLVEEWIYDFGRSRLRQHLRFENGQLKEVKDLGRGRR